MGARALAVVLTLAAAVSAPAADLGGRYALAHLETRVVEPARGTALFVRVLGPDPVIHPGESFPAVILVPGGTGAGAPALDRPGMARLASEGFVIVAFNPPGRGSGAPGNLMSEGEEDHNGFAGQDALAAVVRYVAGLPGVDPGNIGILTNSFGIALGAGAVGRYPELPVAWLVDMEGPSDSLVVACYYCETERGLAGHLSTVTDPSPGNVAWWEEREAFRYIGNFRGEYLRVQAWDDHVQPEGFHRHTLQMVEAALEGGVPWVRINGSDVGNPVNLNPLETGPVWLAGRLADHPDLDLSYIIEMARRSGAPVEGWWNAPLDAPHDVKRLPDGTTLIAAGAAGGTVLRVDAGGRCVALYRGGLLSAEAALRLDDGHMLIVDAAGGGILEIDGDHVTVWSSGDVSLSDGSRLSAPADVEWLEDGRLLVTDPGNHRVVELARDGTVDWQFGRTGKPGGDEGLLAGPRSATRLPGGVLIADSDNGRVLEVDGGGAVVWRFPSGKEQHLDGPRDAERLPGGTTLVADSGNGRVLEVDPAGEVVWEHGDGTGFPVEADRLPGGTTLIADPGLDRVVEVDPGGTVVWRHPPQAIPDRGSPFGFHPASIMVPGYPFNGFTDALALGVGWHRPPVYAFWYLVQPDPDSEELDFGFLDRQYGDVPPDIAILANIAPENPARPEGRTVPGTFLPVDEAAYRSFVRATVERYDGDGIDDMPGLVNPVLHWQVGNEPRPELTGFAGLQRMTWEAVKEACPDCTVLIGGVAGFPLDYIAGFDRVFGPILEELGGNWVDVFDFHWYGTASGEYRLRDTATGRDVLDHLRSTLERYGFPPDLPLWITEMGTYSGDPVGERFPPQTERQQARDLFKRYVEPLSRGVGKVFMAFGLMEGFLSDDGYFDHTGLIHDGLGPEDAGLGVRKLGYYTYQAMTTLLGGADWSSLESVVDREDGLRAYRLLRNGEILHIAWWDGVGGSPPVLELEGLDASRVRVTAVVPSAETGGEVEGSDPGFPVTVLPVEDGRAAVPVGGDPVVIERLQEAPLRHPSGRVRGERGR